MRRLKFLVFLFLFSAVLKGQTYTVGMSGGDFSTLYEAFDYINSGGANGDIVFQIIESTDEIYGTAILNESGSNGGLCDYTSVTIYPTAASCVISGNVDGPLIELFGADNVNFDGRVDQAGAADMVITNTSTGSSASTIKFSESAQFNIVQYCYIKGATSNTSGGVLLFATSTAGTGNDNNTIENSYLTADVAGRPRNMIYSAGTASRENSDNTINNNFFYDFLNKGAASTGISLNANTTTWNITDNNFYESASFVPTGTGTYYIININNTSGNGFVITGNYIGGSDVACGGSAWDKTNASNNIFYGMYLNVGTSTATSIQSNTIRNFTWANSLNASWYGINIVAGSVNIGTTTGNNIGDDATTGSITFTGGSNNANFYGIAVAGSGTVDCRNNTIGSVTTASSVSLAAHITGILSTNTGTITISNNTIGSETVANSLNASSVSGTTGVQLVYGINNTGAGTLTISSNTVANLTNGTTNSSVVRLNAINGIRSNAGTVTVTDNIIHDLLISSANTSTTVVSACGLALSGVTLPKTVTGNLIYNISNNFSGYDGAVAGITFLGSTTPNTVSGNFIHSLTISGITSADTCKIYGIKIFSGATTYSNNIISLSTDLTTQIFGIYETGTAGNDNSIFFNSVLIEGSPSSAGNSRNSYCLYSLSNTNAKNFRNNILHNARSNNGASGTHYAVYFATTGGTLTCDYNDYYTSGTGGILGYFNGNKNTLPVVTSQDANSFAVDPVYTVPGSGDPADYTIGVDLIGVDGTGITSDFGGDTRNNPTLGAWERLVNKWKGGTSTAWNLASNWTANAIPLANANIIFDDAPSNNLYLDASRTVNNVTNSSTSLLVTNGNQLTVKGVLNFTNGAQIDASSSSSTLVYSGTAAQQIDGADFVSSKAYNITVDNTPGVTLESDFTIDNALTINSGKKFVISAGTQLTVSGTLTNSAGNSGLVIRSTSNGNDGKLINNTASVPATVRLFISGGAGTLGPAFHYITPPVASMSIDNSSISACMTSLGLTYFGGDLMLYDETKAVANKNAGWQYFDGYGSTTGFTSLLSSRGYNMYVTAGDSITFTGNLNASAHTFNLIYTGSNPDPGWNLVGNPYPCNYDLNGISELTTDGDGVDNTIYFNHDGGYAYWNPVTGGTSGYSDILPPMQGFYVRATQTGKSLSLPTASKTGTAALPVRSKGAGYFEKNGQYITMKKVKLALSKGNQSDETIVCLIDDATPVFDSDYDAFKLFAGKSTSPALYSKLGSTEYAINSVSETEGRSTIIPLNVIIKTAGEHKISVPEFENLEGTKVVLKHGTTETILSLGAVYTFTSPEGTFSNFELIIGEESIITGDESLSEVKFRTWYNNDYIYILAPSELVAGTGRMIISDMQGRTVYNNSQLYLVPGETIQMPVNLNKGIYVVSVLINNRRFTSKIVIL